MSENYVDALFEGLYRSELERKDKHDALDGFLLAAVTVLGGVGVYWVRMFPNELWWVGLINVFSDWIIVIVFLESVVLSRWKLGVMALCAVVPSVLAYLVCFRANLDVVAMLFVAGAGTFGGFFSLAVISMTCSVWPRDVAVLTSANELRAHLKGLRRFYASSVAHANKVETATEDDFREIMRDQYIECCEVNRESNMAKSKWQSRSRYLVAFSVVCVVVNFIPTFLLQSRQHDPPTMRAVESRETKSKL